MSFGQCRWWEKNSWGNIQYIFYYYTSSVYQHAIRFIFWYVYLFAVRSPFSTVRRRKSLNSCSVCVCVLVCVYMRLYVCMCVFAWGEGGVNRGSQQSLLYWRETLTSPSWLAFGCGIMGKVCQVTSGPERSRHWRTDCFHTSGDVAKCEDTMTLCLGSSSCCGGKK